MKKIDIILKDYVSKQNIDNLYYLSGRFNNRLSNDLAEAINMVSGCNDIDKWLSSAKSCNEFYDMIDAIQGLVDKEINRRLPEMLTM